MARAVDPSTDITAGLTDPSEGSGGGFGPTGARKGPGRSGGKVVPFKKKAAAKGPDPKEEAAVKRFWKEYDNARKFDENFRKQIVIDRRYCAGTADLNWAVTANLIGAFIDILQAILYARDPDVSVKKSPQVDEDFTARMEPFAKTLEIIISYLWRKGKLKKAMKKAVRSVLSNGEGWLKCTFIAEKQPDGEMETAMNDARETLARLQAQQDLLEDREGMDDTDIDVAIAEKKALIEELEDKLELQINKMFVIDYVATENIQVSVDVADISDYTDADWIGNELFLNKEDILERFPALSVDDLKDAKVYYQRQPKQQVPVDMDTVLPTMQMTAEQAQSFTSNQPDGDGHSPEFYRMIEVWDRRDKHFRNAIEGLKKWPRPASVPPYPTSRFFPYFYFAFYPVDGLRHAQSLSWRLYKLQDEYSTGRSNFRLMRERNIGGVLFNATGIDEEQAEKITQARHQELIALRPSDPTTPIGNLFAAKPVASIDMRVYDMTAVLSDMERISGVQEALSAATEGPGNPKTATEANIEQSGTNARTTADRDAEEDMLTELGQYTAEQAIQCLLPRDAQRIAGDMAFWPHGMSIDDLFTLVEVQITGGSTGKPKAPGDQQAWATLAPIVKQTMQEIAQAIAAGDMAMAKALSEWLKETMHRLGDEDDPERFIPQTPRPGTPGAGAPRPPPPVQVSVALKGEISPAAAQQLIGPTLAMDAPPPPVAPPPGGAPGAGGSPPAPVGTTPGAPAVPTPA